MAFIAYDCVEHHLVAQKLILFGFDNTVGWFVYYSVVDNKMFILTGCNQNHTCSRIGIKSTLYL